jgi:hypothetical protein
MSLDTLLDIPPPPTQRVQQLFVWITIDPETGAEGIMSHTMPMEDGMVRHLPLMSSKREVAEKLRPIAERIASLASSERGRPIACVLRTFWS